MRKNEGNYNRGNVLGCVVVTVEVKLKVRHIEAYLRLTFVGKSLVSQSDSR